MSSSPVGGLVSRLRRVGWRNALSLAAYHSWHVLRYGTPRKVWNVILCACGRVLRAERVAGMPYRYYVDPTNVCNLSCPLCPSGLGTIGRPRGMMERGLFDRLVDQMAPFAYVLELYNWGEPFLHPRLIEMIRYAHARRISVRLSSNLNRFTAELAEAVVASGLDRIIVSVDGSTQEVYEQYRRGGDLACVSANLASLLAARQRAGVKHPFVLVRMLVTRKNEHQVQDVRRWAKALGADGFSVAPILVDTTDVEQVRQWLPEDPSLSYYGSASAPENRWACKDLWEAMTINWDGGVSPCCWVHRQEHDLDNVAAGPLAGIWNGRAYRSARRAFARSGPLPPVEATICNRCRGRPLYLRD